MGCTHSKRLQCELHASVTNAAMALTDVDQRNDYALSAQSTEPHLYAGFISQRLISQARHTVSC